MMARSGRDGSVVNSGMFAGASSSPTPSTLGMRCVRLIVNVYLEEDFYSPIKVLNILGGFAQEANVEAASSRYEIDEEKITLIAYPYGVNYAPPPCLLNPLKTIIFCIDADVPHDLTLIVKKVQTFASANNEAKIYLLLTNVDASNQHKKDMLSDLFDNEIKEIYCVDRCEMNKEGVVGIFRAIAAAILGISLTPVRSEGESSLEEMRDTSAASAVAAPLRLLASTPPVGAIPKKAPMSKSADDVATSSSAHRMGMSMGCAQQ
jgi:hypothetical protein